MKKIVTVLLSIFVFLGVFSVCSTGDKGAAKASAKEKGAARTEKLVKIDVVDSKVLDTVKDAPDIGKNNKILSVKVRIAYAKAEPVEIPVDKIIMRTASGKNCALLGIGSSLNGFEAYNFISFPFKAQWFPFSMKYKDTDDAKDLFGLRQESPTNPFIVTFYQKEETILFGLVVPSGIASFRFSVGDSNVIAVAPK